jgi:hypothetical protein
MALFRCFGTWAAQGLNPFLQCLALLSQQTHQAKSGQFQRITAIDNCPSLVLQLQSANRLSLSMSFVTGIVHALVE